MFCSQILYIILITTLNCHSIASLVFLWVSFLSLLCTLASPIGHHSFPPFSPSTFFTTSSKYPSLLPVQEISSHLHFSFCPALAHLLLFLGTSFHMRVSCSHGAGGTYRIYTTLQVVHRNTHHPLCEMTDFLCCFWMKLCLSLPDYRA